MYRMLTGLTLIAVGACASQAPRTEPPPAEQAANTTAALASMRIKGMPQLEAAKLERWQGSVTLLQGVEGKPDTLELGLIAVDEAQEISGGLSFAREITSATGMQINGTHTLNELGALGQPNEFRVTIKGEDYTAKSGKVQLEYVAGQLVGTLDARIEPTTGTDIASRAIAITAQLRGPLTMSCQVLRDGLKPGAEGGEIDDPSAESGPVWIEGGLDHSFCRRYL